MAVARTNARLYTLNRNVRTLLENVWFSPNCPQLWTVRGEPDILKQSAHVPVQRVETGIRPSHSHYTSSRVRRVSATVALAIKSAAAARVRSSALP